MSKTNRTPGLYPPWHDAKTTNPPCDGEYLVIYESLARSSHCKLWAHMGKPEIALYHEKWNYRWAMRGTLTVSFWAHLPPFNGRWIEGPEGECGTWIFDQEPHP